MTPTLVVDLDGTLVDSVGDLAAALNRLMATRHLAPFTIAQVTAMVWATAPRALVARGIRHARGRLRPGWLRRLPAGLHRQFGRADPALPGHGRGAGPHGIRWLGTSRSAPTSRRRRPARCSDALGLTRWFAEIGGGDSFPTRKPDPRHLLSTLAAAGGEPGQAVMLGDHSNDIQAASGAGIASIFAKWGYGAPAMGGDRDQRPQTVSPMCRRSRPDCWGSHPGRRARRPFSQLAKPSIPSRPLCRGDDRSDRQLRPGHAGCPAPVGPAAGLPPQQRYRAAWC